MANPQPILSFNAGELSPLMDARLDVEKYQSGCRTLKNFIVMPYGGAYRRPGTEYLGAAKFADKRCRLIGFNFSTTTNFVLEFGEEYIRFWRNGLQIIDSGNFPNPLEVVTPYQESELRDLQWIQINDVMFFVHPSHAPRKLTRLADDNWLFVEMAPDWPALLDENVTDITLAASGVSGTVTVTASAPAWAGTTVYKEGQFRLNSGLIYRCLSDHTSTGTFLNDLGGGLWELHEQFPSNCVGQYYQIGHDRATASVSRNISSNGSSSGITVLGEWTFNTYGTWTASVAIERSYDNGTTWSTLRGPYVGANDRNITASGNEEREALLRITVSNYSSNTNARALIELASARQYGWGRITARASSVSVTMALEKGLAATSATTFWSEGAWSNANGYPRAVALHEQRVYYGGTKIRPQSIWGSFVDDFQNFRVSTNDDSGLFFTLSSQEANPIQWLTSQDQLLIGTAGNEWTIGSTTNDDPITPSNVRAALQSSYGSKFLRALVVNDVILFVQRQGRKVRELVYRYETEGWVAPDLTILSEHVTKGEILECAFQQQPDAIYWTITGNGQLVGMTYEREQNVVGWHRHTTDGEFESVATIYGASGPDEVWFSIKRTINGQTVRYIERFKTDYREVFEAETKEDWWYLDCAKRIVNAPESATVIGLEHLEGKTVDVLADGAVSPSRTVSAGSITLQSAGGKILCGLSYESHLQPMKLETQTRQGLTKGAMKRVHRAVVTMHKSSGGEWRANEGGQWNFMFSRTTTDEMDTPPDVFTGDKEFAVDGNYSRSGNIEIRQIQPLPMTLLAITPTWEATGN